MARRFDLHTFARYGNEGVLALFSDSTNVERPGFTPSERTMVPRIEELARSAPRRVMLSCFASSIHRIQQVIDIAERVGRKVAFVGRSMVDNVEIAHELELFADSGRDGGAAAGHSGLRSEANCCCWRADRRPSRCRRCRGLRWTITGS